MRILHSVSLAAPVPSSGTLLVLTVHDVAWRSMPEAYPPRGRRWHEAALRRAARRAALFVVPSEKTAEALLAAGVGVTEAEVAIVEEGADHLGEPDGPAARALLDRLGVKGPYLLTVSTLEPRKNLDRLVQAYTLTGRDSRSPGPSSWSARTDGGLPGRARVRSRPTGVVFAGAVDGGVLAAIYGGARCCAYVPIVEGFGLPVVEAMAQGTPVVSSPVPSSAGASLEVDPASVASIAEGLVAAACDESTRADLVARGRERAGSLRWVDAARAHVALWKRVLGEQGGRR